MTKIKATFRSCRGVADCDCCREDPDNVQLIVSYKNQLIVSYKNQPDAEEAEKLLYEEMFQEEMDLQNGAYRKKGNYGRIWTMDEWRTSVRHRPIENVLQIGNKENFLPLHDMWDVYREYHKWRMKNFRDIFVFVSAVVYMGEVPHIHERYVLCWTDGNGVRHTGIDKALKQAGIGIPFPEMKESRYNNRKMVFDRICREAWLDITEEKLKAFPGMGLERPDPEFKLRIKIGREYRLSIGDRKALHGAAGRYQRKMNVLTDRIVNLEEEQEDILSEMEYGNNTADEMAALRGQLLIVKGKIKRYEEQCEKADRKNAKIWNTIIHL